MSFVSLTQLDYDVALSFGSASAAPLRAALAQLAQISGRAAGAFPIRPLRVGAASPAAADFSITVAVIDAYGLGPAPRVASNVSVKEAQWVGLQLSDTSVKGLLLKVWRRPETGAHARFAEPVDWTTGSALFRELLVPSAAQGSARALRAGDVVVIAGVRGAGQEHAPTATEASAADGLSSARDPRSPVRAGASNVEATAGLKPWHWDLKLCDGAQLFLLAGSDSYAAALESVRALLTLYTHRLPPQAAPLPVTGRALGRVPERQAASSAAAMSAASWLPAGVPVPLLQRMADVLLHRCIESGVSLPWLLPSSAASGYAANASALASASGPGVSSLPAAAFAGAGAGAGTSSGGAAVRASASASASAAVSPSYLGAGAGTDGDGSIGELMPLEDATRLLAERGFLQPPEQSKRDSDAELLQAAVHVDGSKPPLHNHMPAAGELTSSATGGGQDDERLVRDVRDLLAAQDAGCDAGVVSPALLRSGQARGAAGRTRDETPDGHVAADPPVDAAVAVASRAARLAADAPALRGGGRTFTVDITTVSLQPAMAPPTSAASAAAAAPGQMVITTAHSVYRAAGSAAWLRRRCATVTLAGSPTVPLQLLIFEFPNTGAAGAAAAPMTGKPAFGAVSAAGSTVAGKATADAASPKSPTPAVRPLKAYADVIQALERAQRECRAPSNSHGSSSASASDASRGAISAASAGPASARHGAGMVPLLRLSGIACMRTAFDDCLVLTTTRLTRVLHAPGPAAATLPISPALVPRPAAADGAGSTLRPTSTSTAAVSAGAAVSPAAAAAVDQVRHANNHGDAVAVRPQVGFKRTMLLKSGAGADEMSPASGAAAAAEPAVKRSRPYEVVVPPLSLSAVAPPNNVDAPESASCSYFTVATALRRAAAIADVSSAGGTGINSLTLSRAISLRAHVHAIVWPGVVGCAVVAAATIEREGKDSKTAHTTSDAGAAIGIHPSQRRMRWVFAPHPSSASARAEAAGLSPGSLPHDSLASSCSPPQVVLPAAAADDSSADSSCSICDAAAAAGVLSRLIHTACGLCGAQVDVDARGIVSGLCPDCSAGGLVAPSQPAVWRFHPAYALLQDCGSSAAAARGGVRSTSTHDELTGGPHPVHARDGICTCAKPQHNSRSEVDGKTSSGTAVPACASAWARLQPHAVEGLLGLPAEAIAALASRHAVMPACGITGKPEANPLAAVAGGACSCLDAAAALMAEGKRPAVQAEAALCGVLSSLLLQPAKLCMSALLLPRQGEMSNAHAVSSGSSSVGGELLHFLHSTVASGSSHASAVDASSSSSSSSAAARIMSAACPIPVADVEFEDEAA